MLSSKEVNQHTSKEIGRAYVLAPTPKLGAIDS